jgi:hypothetical protein
MLRVCKATPVAGEDHLAASAQAVAAILRQLRDLSNQSRVLHDLQLDGDRIFDLAQDQGG